VIDLDQGVRSDLGAYSKARIDRAAGGLRAMTTVAASGDPRIRPITGRDIADALAAGLRDFQSAPFHGLLFGSLYALGGMAIVFSVSNFGLAYLAYPLAAGFALIGPFVAVGCYEVSRARENGATATVAHTWSVIRARGQILWMALVTVFIFILWMYQVRLLMALFLGVNSSFTTVREFLTVVLTTQQGIAFLVAGNVVGAVLSLVVFSLTVVSFPLLLDRDVDFVTAMITSVQAVATNPVPMIGWALVIVLLLIVSILPFFLGLVVTIPVLGHTTWHLYRRIVAPPMAAPEDQVLSA
jgi:uncharacterized membrane protein